MSFNKGIKNILITGGAGFIGGTLINKLLFETDIKIHNIDFMGYASDRARINKFKEFKNRFFHYEINLSSLNNVAKVIKKSNPDLIIHLAAESHVDRSLDSPEDFIQSNIIGTFNLLKVSISHYNEMPPFRKEFFKFHHVSTDEVFGSLDKNGLFTETSKYSPRSPYSASKASSDHLVRAWHHSYSLPTVITNCSNNFGPYQFPEKLIPLTILKAINGQPIPIYGNGQNIRDWINVQDHVEAIILVACKGKPGSTYCIGGNSERKNIEIVNYICDYLDKNYPDSNYSYSSKIEFVKDRPGHDYRYAINAELIEKELGWKPKIPFEIGLEETILWYLNNQVWVNEFMNKSGYNFERLGLRY